MRKILITGTSGFVGQNLVRFLLDNTDWEIFGVDQNSYPNGFDNFNDDEVLRLIFATKKLDFSKPDALLQCFLSCNCDNLDYAVNLASISSVDYSIANPVETIQNNIGEITGFLEICRKYKPKKILHISTDEVYGETYPEDNVLPWSLNKPSNPYAASKTAQVSICQSYWRTYKLPIYFAALCNNYGPHQSHDKLIPRIITSLLNKEKVKISGVEQRDGYQNVGTRNWIHVKDTCEAIYQILNEINPLVRKESLDFKNKLPLNFNITDDNYFNNIDMVDKIANLMKLTSYGVEYYEHEEFRPGHDRSYFLKENLLQSLIGWKPNIKLEDGLNETIEYYRKIYANPAT